MAQKVVLRIPTMTDDKTKQKAVEAVADIYGIDSIAADLKDNKMTVIGAMDTVAIAKRLKKLGKIDIVSVGPAKEEKKPAPAPAAEKKGEEKKEDKKEEKKDDKKVDKK
ncbi:heavy metal-associated isoprenylated plant protein 39-like [Triticum urartu]|uniref:HMA domain-containing protein n=1 Tax=Triticum urartu TaxID=4572 RepID=A0A8R7QNX0_TRIUA|nr:heavy metal-associated isoprenylated plant protein 39-like [Triticum urartu]